MENNYPEDRPTLEIPSIQWFPGHMAKTRRLIGESLKLVDLVLEITDARIPQSARNPELDSWVAGKPRIILLNKADNADKNATDRWLRYYKSEGIPAFACDSKSGNGVKQFVPLVKEVLKDLIERRTERGMSGKTLRIMVVGIPNVGKSSFINRMANSRRAKVEDRPGVTRGRQWVTVSKEIELLDMPGVLWPKFDNPIVGERLAFTGAVKDDVIDLELLAARLLSYLAIGYPERLKERYKLTDDISEIRDFSLLELIGKKRGMILSKAEIDTERAAIMVLDEYRAGKLGKITFELPNNDDLVK